MAESEYVYPMKFPATSDTLKRGGWMYDNDSRCRGCGKEIEWWLTPKGKKMPLEVRKAGNPLFRSEEVREPHWANCENAADFRKK